MTKIFKSILFALLTFSILPSYAGVVVYRDHHRYYGDGRDHYHHYYHHYCGQHKQWIGGHWISRPRFNDRVWIPGHWAWVRWCR